MSVNLPRVTANDQLRVDGFVAKNPTPSLLARITALHETIDASLDANSYTLVAYAPATGRLGVSMASIGTTTAFSESLLGWVGYLDHDDRLELLNDLRNAEESGTSWDEVLVAWRASAVAISDPLSRSILLGEVSGDDFMEVTRPE